MELKAHNLPGSDVLIAHIDAKPNYLFVIFIVVGIISFLFGFPTIYGINIILISIIAMIYMPRVVLMEFYQNYLVMYNKADHNSCVMIYYNEVNSWYYSWGANHDYLYIELENGNVEKIEAFSKTLFESNMNRFLKDKRKKNK